MANSDNLVGKESPEDNNLSSSEMEILSDLQSGKYKGSNSSANDDGIPKNDKIKEKIEGKIIGPESPSDQKSKRAYFAFKYSEKGKGDLHEAVILTGTPTFIKCEKGQIKVAENIEEVNRIIKSPSPEQYPYEPYEFTKMDEVLYYFERAKTASIDSLYLQAKEIASNYNDQDQDKVVLLATDIVWSYFQDRFSTTHYVAVIGDNGSGKSSYGDTFEAIGYRVVNITDPTAANISRVLGTLEFGQCTIVADEAEKVDKSLDIMSVLKTGYSIRGKVARINQNSWKQEFFWTYCIKMIIAERAPNLSDAKGVLDRTFIFTTYRGEPKYDIKETLNPQGNPTRQKLLEKLMDFRKLMLVYRLLHFKDPIVDVDVGVKGRDKELSKPVIQLFYNTNAQKEIESTLQRFLTLKSQRKENAIEAALHPIIVNLVSSYGKEIYASQIWEAIVEEGGIIEGYYDRERKPNEYQTADYGTIYRNSITNIICDKFGAERRHRRSGAVLIFDPEKLVKVAKGYNLTTTIQTKIILANKGDGCDGCDDSVEKPSSFNKGLDAENSRNEEDFSDNTNNLLRNSINITTRQCSQQATFPTEPSQLSRSSQVNNNNDILSQVERSIFRIGQSDTWACKNCRIKDDKWFMKKHHCSGLVKMFAAPNSAISHLQSDNNSNLSSVKNERMELEVESPS